MVATAALAAMSPAAAASDCQVQRWILPGGTHAIEGCVVPVDPRSVPATGGLNQTPAAASPPAPPPVSPTVDNPEPAPAIAFDDPPADDDPTAPAIAKTAESTGWIAVGEPAAPAVWMVIDPECPACAAAIARLAAPLSSGHLSLRAILTPFLGPDSLHRSAEILLAEYPDMALLDHEMAKSVGLAPPPAEDGHRLSNLGHRMLHENLSWMNDAGITAVPHFLWRDKHGTWHQLSGDIPTAATLATAMPSATPQSRLYLPASWPRRSESLPAVVTPEREITAADMRAPAEDVPGGG